LQLQLFQQHIKELTHADVYELFLHVELTNRLLFLFTWRD